MEAASSPPPAYYLNSSHYLNADEALADLLAELLIEGVALTAVSCLGFVGNCASFLPLANVRLGSFARLLR